MKGEATHDVIPRDRSIRSANPGMKWLGFSLGLLVTVGAAVEMPAARVLRGQNDFLAMYCGARLSGTGDLHSVAATKAMAEREAGYWIPAYLFIRPDYYAILLRPLAWLSYKTAYALFQILSLAALLLLLKWTRAAPGLWMLSACSIPLVVMFANGQDVMLFGLAFAACVLLDGRGRGFLAGLALSFCTIKFHLFLFVPLALLAYRKWKTIAGASAGTALGIAAACFVEGPRWIPEYAAFLRRPELHPLPFPLNYYGAIHILGLGHRTE